MLLPIWSPPRFFAPSSPPHSFHSLVPTTPPLFFSPFPRCPRTSSPPPILSLEHTQPITTWAETMGSGDKPGASQSNPFDRVETPLELARPPFQPLKCIVTLHPRSSNTGEQTSARVSVSAPRFQCINSVETISFLPRLPRSRSVIVFAACSRRNLRKR